MFSLQDRRKKFIINKHFQWQTTLIGLVYLCAVGVAVAIPFVLLLRAANEIFMESPRELIAVLNSLKRFWMFAGPISLLAIMASWIFFSLRRSHGVVGPIASIIRIINEFARGDFSARVKLRTHDQLQDIARALDAMAENLSMRERILNEKLIHRIRTAKKDIYENTSVKKAYAILADLEDDIGLILEKYPLMEEGAAEEKPLACNTAGTGAWRSGEANELLNN